MKKKTLQTESRSIVGETKEKKMIEWFKKRKANVLSSLVTTAQVKNKWKEIYGKPATEYAMMIFKHKFKIKVVFSKQSKNTNCSVYKN